MLTVISLLFFPSVFFILFHYWIPLTTFIQNKRYKLEDDVPETYLEAYRAHPIMNGDFALNAQGNRQWVCSLSPFKSPYHDVITTSVIVLLNGEDVTQEIIQAKSGVLTQSYSKGSVVFFGGYEEIGKVRIFVGDPAKHPARYRLNT